MYPLISKHSYQRFCALICLSLQLRQLSRPCPDACSRQCVFVLCQISYSCGSKVLVQFDSIMKRPASSISRTTSGKRTSGVTQLPLHGLYEKAISKAPAWEKALLHELSSLGHYPAGCNRKKATTMQALEEDQLAKRLSKRIC